MKRLYKNNFGFQMQLIPTHNSDPLIVLLFVQDFSL